MNLQCVPVLVFDYRTSLTCIQLKQEMQVLNFLLIHRSSTLDHHLSLSLSKPWESYRLCVLSSPMAMSQSGGVTSLPYINTVTPLSTDSVPLLYTSTEPVSLPETCSSVSEIRGPSDPKVSKFF